MEYVLFWNILAVITCCWKFQLFSRISNLTEIKREECNIPILFLISCLCQFDTLIEITFLFIDHTNVQELHFLSVIKQCSNLMINPFVIFITFLFLRQFNFITFDMTYLDIPLHIIICILYKCANLCFS